MDTNYIIQELERNKNVFKNLFENVSIENYLWKQQPQKWCMLEIVCHLYDEEWEDFRARVKHVLENSASPLTPINPVGWVTERRYFEQDFNLKVTGFLNERDQSVQWLKELIHPQWNNIYHHETLGEMSAKKFLTNWLAHDYLHIRQILKLKYDFLQSSMGENLSYAGEW